MCGIFGNHWYLDTCTTSRSNILRAFNYTLSTFESTVSTLIEDADTLDIGLDTLEGCLRSIRDLLSNEAGSAMSAKDDILSDLRYLLGWRRRKLTLYKTRISTVQSVKAYRNAASAYVGGVRGRLLGVAKELKVLKELAAEYHKSHQLLPMEPFVHAILIGVTRLQDAQIALAGGGRSGSGHSKMVPMLESGI